MQLLSSRIKKRINFYTAYLLTLYYFEIIYLMFTLLVIYGKVVSVAVGFSLSVILAFHIILLYFKKKMSRKIQLFIMDIHAAYAIAFFISYAVRGIELNIVNITVITIRSIILIFELPLIYFLTEDEVIVDFN